MSEYDIRLPMSAAHFLELIKQGWLPCEAVHENPCFGKKKKPQDTWRDCEDLIATAERLIFLAAMEKHGYNQIKAAQELRISTDRALYLRKKYLPQLKYHSRAVKWPNTHSIQPVFSGQLPINTVIRHIAESRDEHDR